MKPIAFLALLMFVASTQAQPAMVGHPAVSDPAVVDVDFPPAMMGLTFESEGSRLNGLMYVADGPGPHPVVLLLHGFPGNEKNLDLAQAMRRSGVNVVFFHYRGSWGSGGTFGFGNAVQDVANVLATVQDSTWAAEHRSDPTQIGLVGHSFGSFVGAMTVGARSDIACFAYLDGWDAGATGLTLRESEEAQKRVVDSWSESHFAEGGPLRGDPASAVAELVENADSFSIPRKADALAQLPLLVISASRAFGATHDALVATIRGAGASDLTELILDDDHSFSASRIELARLVVDWQGVSCW